MFAGRDTNLYGYVFNDPVNLIDPNGQCVWCAGAAFGTVIGGVSGYLNTGTVQALGCIMASKVLQIPFGVLGRAPGQAGRFGQVSNSIISSSVGGIAGSGFDLLGGQLTNSCQ